MVVARGLAVDVETGQSAPLPDPDITDVGHLAERAVGFGCASVLVVDHTAYNSLAPVVRQWTVESSERFEAAHYVRCGSQAVSVIYLPEDAAGQAGPWRGLEPGELVLALRAFQRAVGVPWLDSPGRTTERLILSTHPR